MVINNAEFKISVGIKSSLFNDDKNEIAFIGRSNVGKSSLINYLTNRKALARTSNTPGRTRLINYFEINKSFYFVDLPGYGFALGNKKEQDEWKKLIENYLEQSKKLKLVCLLLDIRRDISTQDEQMLKYLEYYHIPFIVIVTKADKVGKSQVKNMALKIGRQVGIGDDNVLVCSVQDKVGKEKILEKMEQFLGEENE